MKTGENSIIGINAAVWEIDILSLVGISWSNFIGHDNRMHSERKKVKYFTIIRRGNDKEDEQKTDDGTVYQQILKTGKRSLKP